MAEEALLVLQTGVPLYVAGGYGGCGRAVAHALGGSTPNELRLEYQLQHTPRYPELFEAASSAGNAPSFEGMVATFATAGVAGLHNHLDGRDNTRLSTTDNVDEVIALVLRGLRQVAEAT